MTVKIRNFGELFKQTSVLAPPECLPSSVVGRRPEKTCPEVDARQAFGVTNSISSLAVTTRVRPHAAGKCRVFPVTT